MILRMAVSWPLAVILAVSAFAQEVSPSQRQPQAPGLTSISPDEAVQRAKALRESRHSAEALDLLKNVLKATPNNVEANLLAAEMLMDANDFDLARNYFKQVLDNEPSNFRANLGTGKIWIANHYWRQAASYLEKAENVAPAENRAEGPPNDALRHKRPESERARTTAIHRRRGWQRS